MPNLIARTWRPLGYSLCNVSISLGTTPLNLLLLYYLTDIIGLPAGLAGLAIALPKIWDALIDPAFGGWVDRISVRIGSRTPAILISGAVFIASLILVFSLPRHGSPGLIMTAAALLLTVSSASQTALGVSQYALAAEMTTNPAGVSTLLSVASIISQIFSVVAAALIPLMVGWSGGGHGGYVGMAVEVGSATALLLLLFSLSMRRVPVRAQAANADDMSLRASVRATGANHAFYYVMGFVLCANASAAVLFALLPFANQYVLGGTTAALSALETCLGVAALAGMALAPLLVRRRSAVWSMRLCNGAVAAATLMLLAASFGPLWLSLAALAVAGLGAGATGILVQTTTLQAARANLGNARIVALGFYLGIMLAAIKIGSSAGSFVSGELLSLADYHAGIAVQSVTTLWWLRAGYTIVPFVFLVAGSLCLHRVRLSPDRRSGSADDGVPQLA